MNDMISKIVKKIELQDEIVNKVLKTDAVLDYKELRPYITLLNRRDTWDEGVDKLKKALGEDPEGIKMLTVMLHCGEQVHDKYTELGINEAIYADTMKCFTRFLNEHKKNYGFYKFDRGFWTARQISMQLFRIGELEYELDHKDEVKIVSIHIPSDADMERTKLRNSHDAAKEFLGRFYPEYGKAKIMCESWLLSPSLRKLLPESSKIIRFQSAFSILETDPESKDYLEWVYKVHTSFLDEHEPDELPEDTSLQKHMKKFLQDGGKVGMATGVLLGF